MEFVNIFYPYKEVFFELFRVCNIAVVQTASSAACEWSFSKLKQVKNHWRSIMAENRLTSIAAVLSIEPRRAKALDLDEFVERFAAQHGNRRIQFLQSYKTLFKCSKTHCYCNMVQSSAIMQKDMGIKLYYGFGCLCSGFLHYSLNIL